MSDVKKPKPNALVRWFVIGLPLGLIIMGVLSFVIYFQKRHAKEHPPASKFSSALRKDLNIEDYRRYVGIFRDKIGPRTLDKPENIAAAQSFIESTMGFDNMGYQVVREDLEVDGKPQTELMVELTGRSSANNFVLVTADYSGARSEDISALLVLAHAFTGTAHFNKVRFIARFGEGKRGLSAADATGVQVEGPPPDADDALKKLREIEARVIALADAR
jgi:hypothetical protein